MKASNSARIALRASNGKRNRWEKISLLKTLLFMLLLLVAPHSVFAYILTETAPEGKWFEMVKVEWTHDGALIPNKIAIAQNVQSVTFDTRDLEKIYGLKEGYITDWKQYRKLNDGTESTLEGVFAKAESPYNFLSYQDAYFLLGLEIDDFLYLPDFSLADIDNDGIPETHLYSAVNLYELASNYPQFINNQAFNYGQPYNPAQFTEYGFVFSLLDNIEFDTFNGYITPTPLPESSWIVADSQHITGLPAPGAVTLGLLGLGTAVSVLHRRKALC